jgi:hypothetical protein
MSNVKITMTELIRPQRVQPRVNYIVPMHFQLLT